jgi:hypothetical protein
VLSSGALPETACPNQLRFLKTTYIPATGASNGKTTTGGVEVTIFSGPDARDRAFQYAEWRYRHLVEVPWRRG